MLKSQNILDAWVLVWGDDVAVLQPDDIRQWVSNGFDSQFNQSALLHTDVPQFLSELWTHQGFLGWKRKLNESKPIPQHFAFWKKLQVERIWSCILTINSESDGDGCASSSVLSHHSPFPGVLWQSWDDDQGLSAILFNHDLVGVVTNYLLPWEEDSWVACEINKFCSNSFWRFPLCCTHHCGTSTSQALVCPQPSGQIWQFVPQNIYMMKASWQKQACRVFLAEPHQSHLADEQENVQVNDWENGQVSGSESEEMWTWESINPCHFPYRQCSLFQALWISLPDPLHCWLWCELLRCYCFTWLHIELPRTDSITLHVGGKRGVHAFIFGYHYRQAKAGPSILKNLYLVMVSSPNTLAIFEPSNLPRDTTWS